MKLYTNSTLAVTSLRLLATTPVRPPTVGYVMVLAYILDGVSPRFTRLLAEGSLKNIILVLLCARDRQNET